MPKAVKYIDSFSSDVRKFKKAWLPRIPQKFPSTHVNNAIQQICFHSKSNITFRMPSDESTVLLATLLPLAGLFLLWGYCNFRNGWSEGFHSGLQVTPVTLEPTHVMPDHRMRVIEKIFPIPPRNEDSVIIFYDLESKQYEVDESGSINLSAVSCSICLEDFGKFSNMIISTSIPNCRV
jgi:hypothetical protein